MSCLRSELRSTCTASLLPTEPEVLGICCFRMMKIYFETRSHKVTRATLKLILLSLPPECTTMTIQEDGSTLRLTVVMVVQVHKHTKRNTIVHFTFVDL